MFGCRHQGTGTGWLKVVHPVIGRLWLGRVYLCNVSAQCA